MGGNIGVFNLRRFMSSEAMSLHFCAKTQLNRDWKIAFLSRDVSVDATSVK
jgi:hypothetical protein